MTAKRWTKIFHIVLRSASLYIIQVLICLEKDIFYVYNAPFEVGCQVQQTELDLLPT